MQGRKAIAAGAGAIALLLAGVAAYRVHPFARVRTSHTATLQDVVAAFSREPRRPLAGRLTGGFAYRPWSDEAHRVTPATYGALAAYAASASAGDHGRAAALLLAGRTDEAIALLESPADPHPSAAALSDLAAAYLERGRSRGHITDLVRALASAEHALSLSPRLPEAIFNAAMAAGQLGLVAETRRLEALLASVEHDRWAGELASLPAPAPETTPDRQRMRERVEDELLPAWGRATLSRDSAASRRAVAEAEPLVQALAATGERMPLDALASINDAAGDSARVTALARGFVAYGDARRALAAVDLGRAAATMAEAARNFRRAGSLYALWAPVFSAIRDRMTGQARTALQALDAAYVQQVPAGYLHLRGRVAWTRAVSHASLGQLDAARSEYLEAIAAFAQGAQLGHLAAMQTMLAEVLADLGNDAEAWQHQGEALRAWRRVGGSSQPDIILLNAAILGELDGLPRASLPFLNELVAYESGRHDPTRATEASLQRARVRFLTGDAPGAADDLRQAETVLPSLSDGDVRRRLDAEIAAVRALSPDAGDAIDGASRAVAYFRRAGFRLRTVELLTARARAELRLGRVDAAEADLTAAITVFERQRRQLAAPEERAESFAEGRAAFVEMIRLQAVVRKRPDLALPYLERSATGAALDAAAFDARRRALAPDTAVVAITQLDDRLLVWVLTRDRDVYLERPFARDAVDRIVGRFRAAIASEAEAAEMAAASRAVTDAVFGGSLAGLPRVSRLAIVADGALFGVPFAALQGPSGRALVEDYRIEMASSLRAVLAAPARVPTASVRAIGDGHVPEPGLPHLPRADAEAEAVAALYPDARTLLGDTATRPAVLDAFGTSDVLHFAGHSVANIEHPQFAFLLAAPARGDAAGGAVFAKDIYARSFSRTSVVVLASCETAVGAPIFGEGPMSLAKPFLARGARYVVASLWRVDDAAASALAFAFHRALRLTGDPRIALRQAQASLLHATDPARRAPRAWGAFVVYIGEPIAGKDDR